MTPTETFRRARDFLLQHREDYATARTQFRWPEFETFNWALDWFDIYAGEHATQIALWLLQADGSEVKVSFAELAERSSRIASFLRGQGVQRGERVLIMLPNVLPIWEVMLGAMKCGAVIVPTSVQATPSDLVDRVTRGAIKLVVTDLAGAEKFAAVAGYYKRVLVGDRLAGWLAYQDALASAPFVADAVTRPDDPLLLYFTSGTTAKPKLVLHTHRSYPVGHLSTMYWIGIREGDIHQNISSPGWAKHAWSSFFAPWNAGATIFVHDYARFDAQQTLDLLARNSIHSLCAPPTVWRMLILESLGKKPAALRDLVSAGEPLNPEVIEKVQAAWGVSVRDGYGQTETTAQIGNPPGQPIKPGSMGRPLPGYEIALLGADGSEAADGEIAIRLTPRPAGLMVGYLDDPDKTDQAMAGGFYRTGDEAGVDADGYFRFVGRGDDVFKSSDYRISPFELESVLLEHEAVAEAAVVPSPDPLRFSVPKAFVVLKPGVAGGAATARDILQFVNARVAPYRKIRRIEFAELPKTISGKIRRVQLRSEEQDRRAQGRRGTKEHWLEDWS